ncbi:NIL domain-containing protein, partial [Frankia sp. Cpl3]|nr:NIL domain-containing protein [Frankia sp. Cpl3]
MPQEILAKLKNTLPNAKILRVAFRGDAALDPVLGTLSARYPVSTNLLYGSISSIKGTALGILLLHISGEEKAVQQ